MPTVSIAFCQCCQKTFKRSRGSNGHTLCNTCRPKFLGLSGMKLREAIARHRNPDAKPTLVIAAKESAS